MDTYPFAIIHCLMHLVDDFCEVMYALLAFIAQAGLLKLRVLLLSLL